MIECYSSSFSCLLARVESECPICHGDVGACNYSVEDHIEQYKKRKEQSMSEEIRVTDPVTGGQKGSKLARFDLIPWDALWLVAEVFGYGAKKYEDRNWEKGYAWGLSLAALHRHLTRRLQGEIFDDDPNFPPNTVRHLAQVVWHALVLLTFELRGLGTDNVTQPIQSRKSTSIFAGKS